MKFEGTSRLTRVQGFIPAEPSLLVLADDPEPPKKYDVSFVPVRTVYHSAIFEDLQAGRTLEVAHSLSDKQGSMDQTGIHGTHLQMPSIISRLEPSVHKEKPE